MTDLILPVLALILACQIVRVAMWRCNGESDLRDER